ncbi:sperm-tail PG-rich repeat-containing protein 2 [Ctenodactylus gundi]
MYDRAPRLLRVAEGGSTGEHVGPGSYQVPLLKPQATDGYAPFLSLTARESTYIVANVKNDVPGPGHYNVSKAQCNIKGGHSLQNREKRFEKSISDNPGPASYGQFYPGTLDSTNRKALDSRKHLQSKISRTPTVSRNVDVPSIPCGQSYGYHISEDDRITKCFPPDTDSTLGPAFYKPEFGVSCATLKYKGVHFGSSTGRRELPTKSDPGPGPGHYDVVQKKILRCENINIKKGQQQSHWSYIPRLHEIIILQEEKKGVPGPGRYDIKSQFQKTESKITNVNGASSAFLSQSQRFVPVKSLTLAPGTYNEPRTALKSSKKPSGLKNIPFGQSTPRFTPDCQAWETPGPGFYNILNNTITASAKNICSKKQKKSAFGSSAPRPLFLFQKEVCTTPGPSEYQGVPAPGSYDVQKSYEMSQVKHKYMPPRSLVAKRKHASFLSGTPRYLEKVTEGPGPGAYNPILRESCPVLLICKASKRFEDLKEVTPGPATYELSPFLRHSVLKRTFNVTLADLFLSKTENILPTDRRARQKCPRGKRDASQW